MAGRSGLSLHVRIINETKSTLFSVVQLLLELLDSFNDPLGLILDGLDLWD